MNCRVEFDDLIGTHVLTGFWRSEAAINNGWDLHNADAVTFILNGVTYQALEDPQDGYRSSIDHIVRCSPAPEPKNEFPPVKVNIYKSIADTFEGLLIEDAVSKLIVAEIGTERSDSYYPSFVASFYPEHMTLDKSAVKKAYPDTSPGFFEGIDNPLFGSW
jgi:hypothetical protein